MPNVLYISHMDQASGWGKAARDYILALDSVGVNLTCKSVRLNGPQVNLPNRIKELEKTQFNHYDYCIQHVLPKYLVYSGEFKKNICLYTSETSNFRNSGWSNHINMMDLAIVPCIEAKWSSIDSFVNIPIKVVGHAFDTSILSKPRNKLDFNNDSDFLFYFIGEYNQRKNLPALIRAFHTEFHPSEPVRLLLKVNSPNFTPNQLHEQIISLCNKVKDDLRLYPRISDYKNEIIITDYVSEEQVLDIHNSCDCFVMPSYGEAWCIPAFTAMAFGKYPIVTDETGMSDYINQKNGSNVYSNLTPVVGVKNTIDGLFTGNENWKSISIESLKYEMREHYSNRCNIHYLESIKNESSKIVEKFSYKSIGNKFLEIFNEKI